LRYNAYYLSKFYTISKCSAISQIAECTKHRMYWSCNSESRNEIGELRKQFWRLHTLEHTSNKVHIRSSTDSVGHETVIPITIVVSEKIRCFSWRRWIRVIESNNSFVFNPYFCWPKENIIVILWKDKYTNIHIYSHTTIIHEYK
jgi:hypothetical protein